MNTLPVALHAPWWLLLLPLPWLPRMLRGLMDAIPRDRASVRARADKRQRAGRLENFADPHLFKWLRIGPAPAATPMPVRLAWLLVVVAASGPYLPEADDRPRRFGADVAVVIDISPSMNADDVEPTRLKRAALELRDLIGRLGDDRAALIVYSAYAYRLLPLTHDLELLNHYAGALDSGLTRRHGSNLAQALEYAGQALGDDRMRGRAVLVLSDGETDDRAGALAAAERLRRSGVPVFALGIGTDAGAPVPGAGGFLRTPDGLVISRLDRELLAAVARRSGGAYADARADDRDWEHLIKGLEPLRRAAALPPQARAGYALHPWLLAAAFALLLWSGIRRAPVAALPLMLLAAGLPPHAAHAAPWQEQAAYDALTGGDTAAAAVRYEALDDYTGWLGRGAAYYRQQRWEQALAAFTRAVELAGSDGDRAQALYNRGTTLARLDRYAEAEQALEQSLQLRPNHARAQLNLNLVKRAGARPPPVAGTPRRDDEAERPGSDPDAAHGRADGRGAEAPPTPFAYAGTQTAAGARETPEARLARSLGDLAVARDRPDEILRHRFLVQDAERPLAVEGQSW